MHCVSWGSYHPMFWLREHVSGVASVGQLKWARNTQEIKETISWLRFHQAERAVRRYWWLEVFELAAAHSNIVKLKTLTFLGRILEISSNQQAHFHRLQFQWLPKVHWMQWSSLNQQRHTEICQQWVAYNWRLACVQWDRSIDPKTKHPKWGQHNTQRNCSWLGRYQWTLAW